VPVEGVSFGGAATDPSRFLNLRGEMLWGVREAMDREELSLPDDDDLTADMAATAFAFDARGRIVIAPKAEIRARLGRSPDRCDALALACWGAGMRRARAQWTVFNPSDVLGW
jgi:phage terminase large subunit